MRRRTDQDGRRTGRERARGEPGGAGARDAAGTPEGADVPAEGAPGEGEVVELPIDGSLDLHAFRPKDVSAVVTDYLDECARRGIRSVRIAHGKGIGTLREIVHGVLAGRTDVLSYRLDSESGSGWGATLVELRGDQSPD